jgi:excisionase family DNA binding protein
MGVGAFFVREGSLMSGLTITVAEAAEALGISEWLYYDQFKKGNLPGIRVGRRITVQTHQIEALIGRPLTDKAAS